MSDSDISQDKHSEQERKTYLIVKDPDKFSDHRGMVKLIESPSYKEISTDEECKNQKKLKNDKKLVTKVGRWGIWFKQFDDEEEIVGAEAKSKWKHQFHKVCLRNYISK